MYSSNGRSILKVILIAVFLWAGLAAPALCAESDVPVGNQEAPVAESKAAKQEVTTINALKGIVESLDSASEQLRQRTKELKNAPNDDQKARTLEEIKGLNEHVEMLNRQFEEIASGVNPDTFDRKPDNGFDWKAELQDVLGPLIQSLKSMTARPREIEKLRSEVEFYENRLPTVKNAIRSVQELEEKSTDQKLKKHLADLGKGLKERQQQIENHLAIAQYQLGERLQEKESLFESAQGFARLFFKSRGKNLLLTFLAFVSVFLILRFLQRRLYKMYPVLQSSSRSFYLRLAEVVYHALTFIGATGAALLILYISGDWLLLSIAIIFLFGLAWTAKQTLPIFWEQCKLLLNLGSVRENERVYYKGIPWKVSSLNLYTRLVNPVLQGGNIRLRLHDLTELSSRPYDEHEPWFPCKEGDWVQLADNTRGKVVVQTPEIVQLVLLGGSRKTYLMEEFLKQNPENLSTNFRIKVLFGLDYQHQAEVTTDIPKKLQAMLEEELSDGEHAHGLISVKVEFKEAAASSLDLIILADFQGKMAKNYDLLRREIQRITVDACNKYGWEIPFTQITLHTPGSVMLR